MRNNNTKASKVDFEMTVFTKPIGNNRSSVCQYTICTADTNNQNLIM